MKPGYFCLSASTGFIRAALQDWISDCLTRNGGIIF